VVNAGVVDGLAFSNPREIVTVGWGGGSSSFLEYLDFRQQSRSFKGLGAGSLMSADLSDERAAAERVNGAAITANLFPVLGQKAAFGRDFTPDDEKSSAPPVALLSHSLWLSRYGGYTHVSAP